ncbi:MAG: CoA-binding protein [Candidatus Lokiarchaeota archaeon]|nr:CoA-binding protein [Candidatus Lokiarchaeota archaeon]
MRLDNFFEIDSVAVIGASKNPKKVGHAILKNIVDRFKGKIYPINLNEDKIMGLKCYTDVLSVPNDIDLAIFVIPAKACLKVAEQCGKKNINKIVVITAGFKEIGIEGAKLEKELLAICKKYDIKALGPNVVGFIDVQNNLNASFTNEFPLEGNIALISQSGAIITSIIDWSIPENIGFSKVISLGNKMDLNEIDFLEILEHDQNTKVILAYLESIDEGRRFVEVAKKVIKKKPIIVLKAGISDAGSRAASSHTGALAGSVTAYYAAFNKSGVINVSSLGELFDYGLALSTQPPTEDNSVTIITNAGGAGIITTDTAEKNGLRLNSIDSEVTKTLRDFLPTAAAIHNPIDILGDAGADRYRYVIKTCLDNEYIKNLIVLMSPQAVTEFKETTDVIIEFYNEGVKKPVIIAYLGGKSNRTEVERLRKNGIPCYEFPEGAVRAIRGLFLYSQALKKKEEEIKTFDVDNEKVIRIFNKVLDDERLVLLEHEAMKVAEAYELPVPPTKLAKSPKEAIEKGKEMGLPVVLKISSPDITHKSDLGGIELNLKSNEEVRRAYNNIMHNISERMPNAKIYGITVQKMMNIEGKEIIIGSNNDPQFGHLIMCGFGGIYVNFLEDVAFRLNPISSQEAMEMLSETKVYKLLKGVRGEPPSDIESLIDSILRVSQLLRENQCINELDINPIIVYEKNEGVTVLDIKIALKRKQD